MTNPKGGRPSNIDKVIGSRHNDDGTDTPITVADRIVANVRIGGYLEPAIATSGESKATVYGWLKLGGKAALKVVGRDPTSAGLTKHELACLHFSDAVERASSEWHLNALALLEQIGRGGLPQVRETVKVERTATGTNADGSVRYAMVEVERSTTTTHTLPNAQVLIWRLRHRFPDLYRDRVEVVGASDLSDEERVAALIDGFETYLADVDAATTARTNGKTSRNGQQ